eukprot:m.104276 g.104276  ORF g.104276 m.104276 type:complete len:317 (-) comp8880_c0_seq2:385-1335(-)
MQNKYTRPLELGQVVRHGRLRRVRQRRLAVDAAHPADAAKERLLIIIVAGRPCRCRCGARPARGLGGGRGWPGRRRLARCGPAIRGAPDGRGGGGRRRPGCQRPRGGAAAARAAARPSRRRPRCGGPCWGLGGGWGRGGCDAGGSRGLARGGRGPAVEARGLPHTRHERCVVVIIADLGWNHSRSPPARSTQRGAGERVLQRVGHGSCISAVVVQCAGEQRRRGHTRRRAGSNTRRRAGKHTAPCGARRAEHGGVAAVRGVGGADVAAAARTQRRRAVEGRIQVLDATHGVCRHGNGACWLVSRAGTVVSLCGTCV